MLPPICILCKKSQSRAGSSSALCEGVVGQHFRKWEAGKVGAIYALGEKHHLLCVWSKRIDDTNAPKGIEV